MRTSVAVINDVDEDGVSSQLTHVPNREVPQNDEIDTTVNARTHLCRRYDQVEPSDVEARLPPEKSSLKSSLKVEVTIFCPTNTYALC